MDEEMEKDPTVLVMGRILLLSHLMLHMHGHVLSENLSCTRAVLDLNALVLHRRGCWALWGLL